jgi:hypothetical protein
MSTHFVSNVVTAEFSRVNRRRRIHDKRALVLKRSRCEETTFQAKHRCESFAYREARLNIYHAESRLLLWVYFMHGYA